MIKLKTLLTESIYNISDTTLESLSDVGGGLIRLKKDKSLVTGTIKSGSESSSGKWTLDVVKGKLNGEFKVWFANGNLESVVNYMANTPYGTMYDYYDPNTIDKFDGDQLAVRIETVFDSNGKPKTKTCYSKPKPMVVNPSPNADVFMQPGEKYQDNLAMVDPYAAKWAAQGDDMVQRYEYIGKKEGKKELVYGEEGQCNKIDPY